jgi:hypothetical protein
MAEHLELGARPEQRRGQRMTQEPKVAARAFMCLEEVPVAPRPLVWGRWCGSSRRRERRGLLIICFLFSHVMFAIFIG